jgi:hypothetical protein
MKPEERERIHDMFVELENQIMATKAREYANDENTLQNFDTITDIMNAVMPLDDVNQWRPEHVCAVYLLKQILGLLDNANRGESLSDEGVRGRALDTRVYAMLMYCIAVRNGYEERLDKYLGS